MELPRSARALAALVLITGAVAGAVATPVIASGNGGADAQTTPAAGDSAQTTPGDEAVEPDPADDPVTACDHRSTGGTNCQPGRDRPPTNNSGNVSHKGWPNLTGILWIAQTAKARTYQGTSHNDELLSHHSSDTVNGLAGDDIIWGDLDPGSNPSGQKDRLNGGPGNDWIYSSHGTNVITGGDGNDFIYVYYGHGTVDCGAGKSDRVKVRLDLHNYKYKHCETVLNFCAYGAIGTRCAKPGERAKRSSARTTR